MGNRVSIEGNNNNVHIGSGKELAKRNYCRCSDFADSKKSRDIPESLIVKDDEEFKSEKVNSTKQNSSKDREGLHTRRKTRLVDLKVDLDNTNVKIAERDNDETKPLKALCPNGSILSRVSRALFSCIKPATEQEDSSRTRENVEGTDNLGYVPEASCQDETFTDPVDDSNIEYRDKKVTSTAEGLCKHSAEKTSNSNFTGKETCLEKQETACKELFETAKEVLLGSPRRTLPDRGQFSRSSSCPAFEVDKWVTNDVRNENNAVVEERSCRPSCHFGLHVETTENLEYSNNASLFPDKTPSKKNKDVTSHEKLQKANNMHDNRVLDPEKIHNDIELKEQSDSMFSVTLEETTETQPVAHECLTENNSPCCGQAGSETPESGLNIAFSESAKPWKYPTQGNEVVANSLQLAPLVQWQKVEYRYSSDYCRVEKCQAVLYPVLVDERYEQRHDFRYEEYRRQSFNTYTGNGNAHNLARNGFYHNADESPTSTMCYFCRISKSNWDSDTNIEEEHKRLSPDCPVHRVVESGNVPLLENRLETNASSQTNATLRVREIQEPDQPNNSTGSTNGGYATTGSAEFLGNSGAVRRSLPTNSRDDLEDDGSIDIESTDPGNTPCNSLALNSVSLKGARLRQTRSETNVFVESPRFQDKQDMNIRAGSFRGWPVYLDQTPQLMAEAGFFFEGTADKVQCFSCGGGLRNWERGDDPFVEHARWFPSCIYMTQTKGAGYVAEVQRCLEIYLQKKQEERRLRAQMRDEANIRRESACLRCRQVPANTALLPCRHLVVCDGCAGEVTQCPQCNGVIENRPES